MSVITKPEHRPRSVATPLGARMLLPVAISATGGHMLMHFAAVANAVLKMYGLGPQHKNAVKQRMNAFLRLKFPLPSRSRRKAELGMDEALKIVFAFQLIDAGMSQARAVRLASTDWPIIRDGIAEGWSWLDARADERGDERWLAIAPQALTETGMTEIKSEAPLSETIAMLPLAERRKPNKFSRAMLSIDVGAMVVAFGAGLAEAKVTSEDDFNRAMRLFCTDTFGSDDASTWPGRVPSKGRKAAVDA